MLPILVADLDDPRLALYRGVRDPDLLRAHGAFLAEGRLVVERLLTVGRFRARSVLVTPAAHASLVRVLANAPCPVYVASSGFMEDVAGFHVHRGCLAIGERDAPFALADLSAAAGPVLALENVGNPDNIGAIFRSALAFGAAGMALSPGCSDPLYRKSIRTSMGAALIVPFTIAEPWPQALANLAGARRTIVALTLSADAVAIAAAADALRARDVVLLLGHEGSGLSAAAQDAAQVRARIPMSGGTDSLNVATAAAVALYEVSKCGRVSGGTQ